MVRKKASFLLYLNFFLVKNKDSKIILEAKKERDFQAQVDENYKPDYNNSELSSNKLSSKHSQEVTNKTSTIESKTSCFNSDISSLNTIQRSSSSNSASTMSKESYKDEKNRKRK